MDTKYIKTLKDTEPKPKDQKELKVKNMEKIRLSEILKQKQKSKTWNVFKNKFFLKGKSRL